MNHEFFKSTHKKSLENENVILSNGLTDILIYLFLNINKHFKLTIVLIRSKMKMKRFCLIKANIKLILFKRVD